jgi:hypothetical protein
METWKHGEMKHGDMETLIWRHVHGDMETSDGKRKVKYFSLILLPFARPANRSLPFVRLLMKKQMKVIRLRTD